MMLRTIRFKKTGYAVLVTACLMLGPGISQAQTVVPGQIPQIPYRHDRLGRSRHRHGCD